MADEDMIVIDEDSVLFDLEDEPYDVVEAMSLKSGQGYIISSDVDSRSLIRGPRVTTARLRGDFDGDRWPWLGQFEDGSSLESSEDILERENDDEDMIDIDEILDTTVEAINHIDEILDARAEDFGLDGHEAFEGLGDHAVGDFTDSGSKPMSEDVSGAIDTMTRGLELFGQSVNWPPREAPEDVPGHEDVEEPFKEPLLR